MATELINSATIPCLPRPIGITVNLQDRQDRCGDELLVASYCEPFDGLNAGLQTSSPCTSPRSYPLSSVPHVTLSPRQELDPPPCLASHAELVLRGSCFHCRLLSSSAVLTSSCTMWNLDYELGLSPFRHSLVLSFT